jgi:hypothetical protein
VFGAWWKRIEAAGSDATTRLGIDKVDSSAQSPASSNPLLKSSADNS